MKKLLILLVSSIAITLQAVPAFAGWVYLVDSNGKQVGQPVWVNTPSRGPVTTTTSGGFGRPTQNPNQNAENEFRASNARVAAAAHQAEVEAARQAAIRDAAAAAQLAIEQASAARAQAALDAQASLHAEARAKLSDQISLRDAQAARSQAALKTRLAQNALAEAELQAALDSQYAPINKAKDLLCFPGDTPISVKDDSPEGYHPARIDSIRKGDYVINCNLENGGTCESGRVKKVMTRIADRLIKLTVNGQVLKATENHPFYVIGRPDFVDAQDLRIGTKLQTILGDVVTIDDMEVEVGKVKVYNLKIAGNENYYACGILVHNCSMGSTAGTGLVAVAGTLGRTLFSAATSPSGMRAGAVAVGSFTVYQLTTAAGAALSQLATGLYTLAPPVAITALLGTAAYYGYNYYYGGQGAAAEQDDSAREGGAKKRFTDEQQSLIDMAKKDKRTGITKDDMEAYKDLNKDLGEQGLPEDTVRGPERHLNRPHGKEWHGHVGPVDHIPVTN